MMNRVFILVFCLLTNLAYGQTLKLFKTITGDITPKSIVYTPKGMFAQNMMYSHSITVYDSLGNLTHTIIDKVEADLLNDSTLSGSYEGSPVEAAYTPDSNYIWVSNYQMYGKGFNKPGVDACGIDTSLDKSYLYKIDLNTKKIMSTVKVGAVPKYLAITPDNKYLLVSNWCNGNISIVDLKHEYLIRDISIGKYPRGIAIDADSRYAYVAAMGEEKLVRIDLKTFEKEVWKNIGKGPRHICIDDKGGFLYVSLNKESAIAKVSLYTKKTVKKMWSGLTPRSMVLSTDKKSLYVVNYNSSTVSNIDTKTMSLGENTVKTGIHPIGIAYDHDNDRIWVACYTGSIMIFDCEKQKPALVVKEVTPTVVKETKSIDESKITPEIAKVENKMKPNPVVTKKIGVGNYYVIVGVFGSQDNVSKMLNKCTKLGYDGESFAYKNGLTAISCGRSLTLQESKKIKEKAKQDFGSAWVLKR